MVRSMYAAVAGLRAHQSKMDVISNNIANVNTPGFKTQNMMFKDAMYSTMFSPSAANTGAGGSGGLNASQIGYGAMVSSISTDFSTSTASYTGDPNDFMCGGTGWFMVGPMPEGGPDGTRTPYEGSLSRVAHFTLKNGYLVDSSGNYVYGCPSTYTNGTDPVAGGDDGKPKLDGIYGMTPDADGAYVYDNNLENLKPLKLPEFTKKVEVPGAPGTYEDKEVVFTSYSIDAGGKIVGADEDGESYTLGYLPVVNVDNPNGMIHDEGYYFQMNAQDSTGAAGRATIIGAGKGAGSIKSGFLEAPNVDLAKEFSEIVTTQRGYQANTKMITVTDEMLQELVNMKR